MKVIDPVCGMELDAEKTAISSEYEGQTYCFCSSGCQKAFDRNPERYVKSHAGQTSHGQHIQHQH